MKSVIQQDIKFGYNALGKGKKALVEFVSANPTGPLTVGHGRGTILGDVIANILSWNGYTVHREYYYNNTGNSTAATFTVQVGDSEVAKLVATAHSSPSFTDIDKDGDLDVFVGDGDGTIKFFTNTGNSNAHSFSAQTGEDNL